MKDSNIECEEWWEVAEENFAKELEKISPNMEFMKKT
jgi:hypothetical protein